MKKLFTTFALLSGLCLAQSSTPNIHLTVPAHGTPNWDTFINADLSIIDTNFGYLQAGFQGVWSGTNTYHKGQTVTQTGSLYMSLIEPNAGLSPNSNPSAWGFMVLSAVDTSAFLRTDGTNSPVTGPISTSGITDTAVSSFKNSNNKPFASKYPGADCGIKITAAITDKVSSAARGGVIEGDFNTGGGATTCTGFTIPAGVTVHLWSGNYGFTSSIKIVAGGHLIGDGAGNAGGTFIHGSGTNPAAPLVQSFDQSGGVYWDDASIENLRIDESQGGNSGFPAISIWNYGQSSHISNVEIYNALQNGITVNGSPVPIVLDNVSVFKSAGFGFNIDFGLAAAESGNAFTCYSCTGDDNVAGLFRIANGADRSTALLLGAKGERKIGTAAQDPLITLDHFSGSLRVDSLHAFSLTGGSNLGAVVKIVDGFTPGTPLHPDITISGATIRLYTNVINDTTRSVVVASPVACTLAAPCYVSNIHYAPNGQYNFDDSNGTRQSFGSGAGSFIFSHRIIGESFPRMVQRTGSICLGDGTVDSAIAAPNCVAATVSNVGWAWDKRVTAAGLSSSLTAGNQPMTFASRAPGADPVGNITFTNHPTVWTPGGTTVANSHMVFVNNQTLPGGGFVDITLSGSAVYTSGSSYSCSPSNQTASRGIFTSYTSGSSFRLTGTVGDVVSAICVGN